jgi:glycosyltransferase involved in cell wall biosynthesis
MGDAGGHAGRQGGEARSRQGAGKIDETGESAHVSAPLQRLAGTLSGPGESDIAQPPICRALAAPGARASAQSRHAPVAAGRSRLEVLATVKADRSQPRRSVGALGALTQALIALRPAVRRLMPRALHHAVGEAARWLIRRAEMRAGALPAGAVAFAPAAAPLLAPGAFADGPIVHVNSALAWGGAERQLVNILRGLQPRLRRPMQLVCLRLGESPELDFFLPELAGSPAAPRNALALPQAIEQLDGLGDGGLRRRLAEALAWTPRDFQADVLRLAAEFAVRRPKVVHGWQDGVGLAAAFAALAVGVPRILVACRNVRPASFSYYRPFMRPAYLTLADEPRVVLCNNSEAGARDYAAWLGIDARRIAVVRNGIDAERLRRIEGPAVEARRRDLGAAPDTPLIGSLFRLFAEKRPLLWVRAAEIVARRMPEARFAVFGSGAMEWRVLREVRRRGLGDRLVLRPATANPALALSAFDVFLLTSRYEGTPNVVLEASLLGVPVVAMDAGAVAETVLEGRTGYVIADSDTTTDEQRAQQLADRVLAVLSDAAWRRRVREEGPAFVRARYGMQRMLDETLALYALDGAT